MPTPQHRLPTSRSRPLAQGLVLRVKTNGRGHTCFASHRAEARASPVTQPAVFWQCQWVSVWVGNFSPCPSPVTGTGGPGHAPAERGVCRWLFQGGEQAPSSAVRKNHVPLGLSFRLHGVTGTAIPASPARRAPDTRAPAWFPSPGRRLSPPLASRERRLRVRMFFPPKSGLHPAGARGDLLGPQL